jgi:hypothetical protein
VNPPVPPHVASALTFFVALGTAADDVLVLVARVEGLAVETVEGLTVLTVVGLTVLTGALETTPAQVPNTELHPVPQYASVDPHHPELEQQFPNEELWHVKPPVPPQVPSRETALVGTATGVELRVDVPRVLLGRMVVEITVEEGRIVDEATVDEGRMVVEITVEEGRIVEEMTVDETTVEEGRMVVEITVEEGRMVEETTVDEITVEEGRTVDDETTTDEGRVDVDGITVDERLEAMVLEAMRELLLWIPHFPEPSWQPTPQWSVLDPQYPH